MVMNARRSVAQAKASFTACLRSSERGKPVVITRHGRPVAAIVSIEAFQRLGDVGGAEVGGLARLAGTLEGSAGLASSLDDLVRRRSAGRRLPRLG
jgi:prevent-host-death family protein